MQFLAVKLYCTILETGSTEFLGQSVKCDKLECIFSLIRVLLGFCRSRFAGTIYYTIGFEQFLYLFIFIAAVALDDRMHNAVVLHFCIIVEFEDNAISQFFLVRAK